nr:phage tail protein [Providencia sp. PROV039]
MGAPIPWPQTTAPAGYLVCNGQSFNKTTYPRLAAAYPSGKLPDMRSEFIRGLDSGRNIDTGRTVLSIQGDAIRNITGKITEGWLKGVNVNDVNSALYVEKESSSQPASDRAPGSTGILFDASRSVPTANENRPRNIAFLYIVRAA